MHRAVAESGTERGSCGVIDLSAAEKCVPLFLCRSIELVGQEAALLAGGSRGRANVLSVAEWVLLVSRRILSNCESG